MCSTTVEDVSILNGSHLSLGELISEEYLLSVSDVYSNRHIRPEKNLIVDWIEKHVCFSENARKSLLIQNAGGDSALSEAVSIDYLSRILGATAVTFEREITYYYSSKLVDYMLRLPPRGDHPSKNIGVSVTRCFGYTLVSDEKLLAFLEKKIIGLIVSYNSVSEENSFDSTILHILVPSEEIKERLHSLILSDRLDLEKLCVSGELILWVTHTPDHFIFESRKKLGYNFIEDMLLEEEKIK